jgi:hypothetical protein
VEAIELVAVIARSVSDEAIHLPNDGLLRGACHRARIRATRWLAMIVVRGVPAYGSCSTIEPGLVDAPNPPTQSDPRRDRPDIENNGKDMNGLLRTMKLSRSTVPLCTGGKDC